MNHLKLVKLAVSLGGTESLAQHPYTMTHVGIEQESRLKMGISDQLVRLSIGVENVADLIWDIDQALSVDEKKDDKKFHTNFAEIVAS